MGSVNKLIAIFQQLPSLKVPMKLQLVNLMELIHHTLHYLNIKEIVTALKQVKIEDCNTCYTIPSFFSFYFQSLFFDLTKKFLFPQL